MPNIPTTLLPSSCLCVSGNTVPSTEALLYSRTLELAINILTCKRNQNDLFVEIPAGDAEHKPYICGDADSASTVLDGTEDYLILACDGFCDTVNPDEAVKSRVRPLEGE